MISILGFSKKIIVVLLFFSVSATATEVTPTKLKNTLINISYKINANPNKNIRKLILLSGDIEVSNTENKIIYYGLLSKVYNDRGEMTLANQFALKGIGLKTRLMISPELDRFSYLSYAYYARSAYLQEQGEHLPALKLLDEGIAWAKQQHNAEATINGLVFKGYQLVYNDKSEQTMMALKEAEQTLKQASFTEHDTIYHELYSSILDVYSTMYSDLSKDELSMEYGDKSLAEIKKTNNNIQIINVYINQIVGYKFLDQYDRAEAYGVYLEQLSDEIKSDRQRLFIYNQLFDIYLKKENFKKVAHYEQKIVHLLKLSDTVEISDNIEFNLSRYDYYLKLKQYDKALYFLNQADKFDRLLKKDSYIRDITVYILKQRANLFYLLKKYDEAYLEHVKFAKLLDKKRSQVALNEVEKLQIKQTIEHKNNENKLLTDQIKVANDQIKNTQTTVKFYSTQYIFMILLSFVLFVVLYFYIKQNKENERLQNNDWLTESLNRKNFIQKGREIIGCCESRADKFVVLYLDVFQFKAINQFYDYYVGDLFLKQLAVLINQQLGEHFYLCRWDADNFVLLSKQDYACNVSELKKQMEKTVNKIVNYDYQDIGIDKSIAINIGGYICDVKNEFIESVYSVIDKAKECCIQAKKQKVNSIYLEY